MPQPTTANIRTTTLDEHTTRPGRLHVVRRLLTDDETFGTTHLAWALDQYGVECLHWHPTTLRMELEQDLAIKLPAPNLDRLMAARSILTTDEFFQSAARFVQLANILSGDEFDPTVFEPADAEECAWAVTEALLLNPPDDNNPEPFSDEVRAYIGMVLKDEGFIRPPDVLRIAIGANLQPQVDTDFADDPTLYKMMYDVQDSKSKDVEQVIRTGLQGLLGQLQSLTLKNGQVRDLTGRLMHQLRS